MVKFNHFLSVSTDHLAQIYKSHENREPILEIELQDESVLMFLIISLFPMEILRTHSFEIFPS